MSNAPARQAPKSAAVAKREDGFRALSGLLQSDGMKHKLAMALPKHLTADRLIRIALSASSRQPLLLECSQESIALSLIRAAEFGVEPDGWDAHLVPYKNKGRLECQLIVDYKGFCKLAYQSELVLEIQAGAVRERDLFEYELGSDSFLRHKPTNEDDPGPLVFAWAMAKIKGGGAPFIVLNRRQVMEHKSASTAANSEYSPWNKPATEPSMWKKTALRELAKIIPRSATLHAALKHEDAADLGGEVVDGVIFAGDEGDEPQSKSDQVAGRLGASASETPQNAVDPVAAIRAQMIAAVDRDQARAILNAHTGPETTLNEEQLQRLQQLYEMRIADFNAADNAAKEKTQTDLLGK